MTSSAPKKSSVHRLSEGQSIQSVDRALALLEAIAAAGGEVSLTELAARTGLNISTCHHLLNTLVRRDFASKVHGKRLYALGSKILSLSHACTQSDLPKRAESFVERVSRKTGETVHLAVLQHDTIATLLKRDSHHAVRVDTGPIGRTEAPHATALGKAMMAWLPEDEIRRICAVMDRFTEHTIVDFDALIEDLRHVRRNGYAVDREEFRPGVICIGAAVRNHAGAVVAAISASMPGMRATKEHMALVRDEVMAAARELSVDLGAAAPAEKREMPAVRSAAV
ncbi:MAG: IclR family transcriptional regulator [Pseudolabrys sp.]